MGSKLVFGCCVFRTYRSCPLRRQLRSQGEKIVPAGSAAQRRQAQPPPGRGRHSGNSFGGHSLKLQVPANGAARVKEKSKRNDPRVEACFTLKAAPRNYTYRAEQIIRNRAPPRTAATRGLTRWAVHQDFGGGTPLAEDKRYKTRTQAVIPQRSFLTDQTI